MALPALKGELMSAIVPELVNMASDPTVTTADLLRRALVVARRLDVPDLISWLMSELNGYDGEVPEYRILHGQLKAVNPFRGHVPLQVPAELHETLSRTPIAQSIPELERLAKADHLQVFFDPEREATLMKMMSFPLRPVVHLTSVSVHGIVEKVRSRILDWALDLEERGVLGDGMTFTPREKQIVHEIHNHFGDVSGSQIQISSSGSTQTQANTATNDVEALKGLIDALASALDHGNVTGTTADELRAELATLKAQAASPRPKWEIIKATTRSIRTIAEEAAGNILGELAKPHVATLLALAAGSAGG